MALTDLQVSKAKPSEKPVRLYDGDGLYIEVRPNGGKWWRFKYRFDGKEKLLSMGTYPAVPLAGRWLDDCKRKANDRSGYLPGARDKRDEARALLAAGIDPGEARKEAQQNNRIAATRTLEAVTLAWLSHKAGRWKQGTREAIEASLKTYVFPALGTRPADSIKPADIRSVVKKIEATGATETAGRVFQRLRAVYRYALCEEVASTDPTYSLKPSEIFKPRKTRHRASLRESDVPGFLQKLDAYGGDPSTRLALELLVLTAVRPGELRGARWLEIDIERALWRIPADRMKMHTEHLVPLSRQAVARFKLAHQLSGDDDFVFPSPFYPRKPISDGTMNSALARLGYKGMATAHGMRTLFSTCANEAGWRGDLIEKQLAHEERNDVRAAYNRAQYLEERKKLLQWWADRLDELRGQSEPGH